MDDREMKLGTILKAAEELSQAHNTYPTLKQVASQTGFTVEQVVAALEYEPNPLGWRLAALENSDPAETFTVNGQPCDVLIIDHVEYDHPQPLKSPS